MCDRERITTVKVHQNCKLFIVIFGVSRGVGAKREGFNI